MTWTQLISLAINTAVAGTDADNNPIIKQRLEAAAMSEQALQELATLCAGSPELRSRLEKSFSLTITSGVGSIPAGMLTEYLREGSIRDTSDASLFPNGTPYARIKYLNDFLTDQNTLLGRYCLDGNLIYATAPGINDYTFNNLTLTAIAPFVPTTANVDAEVPDEITNELVILLAKRLRGILTDDKA